MKSKKILSLALLALPFLAAARPAAPGPISYTNPDGTVTEIRIFGDESFSFVTDTDKVNILEQDAKGFWRPAVRNGKVLTLNDANIDLLRSEVPALDIAAPQRPARMAAMDKDGRSLFPTIGEEHFPVVLIEFADRPFVIPNPAEAFNKLCNEENYAEYHGRGSIRDYYKANSNNQFKPIFDIYGPIKVSHNASYYVGSSKYDRWGEALAEAMNKVKEQGVDFSQYDHDNDTDMDFVYFFYAGHSQADTGRTDCIWPHQGDFYNYVYRLGLTEIRFDNCRFGPYACSSELRGSAPYGESQPYMDGIGAFCHEFGHVLGLPDFYDAAAQNGNSSVYTKTPGIWSAMDGGSYNINSTCPPLFGAYEQWFCKWMEYTDLTRAEEGQHCVLNSLGGDDRNAYRLRIQRTSSTEANPSFFNEWYSIENRGLNKWDDGLPEKGMLVWRINYDRNKWTQNRVNTGGVSNIEMIQADPTSGTYCYPTETLSALYPGAPGELNPVSSSSYWRYFLTSIVRDANTGVIDFDYNLITDRPDIFTVMHDAPRKDTGSARRVQLMWDAHPDADGYFVTVKRKDSSGRELIVDGFNEKWVGNVTEVEILNISSSAFKQNMTAYVRVNKLIPSSNISNIISFVPNDLEAGYVESGVEEIGLDGLTIRGLKGAVDAPEGAQVFNLSGIAVGRENLPAGVYIVRFGNEVRKVAVR